MRIYLCGQKAFGREVLMLLHERGHEIAGVSAPPGDRLATAAEIMGVPVLPSGMLNAETLPRSVDLIVAAHSHDFIGRKTRSRAELGAIGYHPSLLPRHRGRDAVRWTIKMGDPVAGGSVYWLSDTMDGGDIAAQDWCFVPDGITAERLWKDLLFPMGLRLMDRVLSDLSSGLIVALPQDEEFATWEPSWERPPARRPDLLMIGAPRQGMSVIRDRERLVHRP